MRGERIRGLALGPVGPELATGWVAVPAASAAPPSALRDYAAAALRAHAVAVSVVAAGLYAALPHAAAHLGFVGALVGLAVPGSTQLLLSLAPSVRKALVAQSPSAADV